MFNWFKKRKVFTFDFLTGKVSLSKTITPEEVALLMTILNGAEVLVEALEKNGHKYPATRMEQIIGEFAKISVNNPQNEDEPAICPTSMVNFGPK